jgi:anti-sigma factor RsiW
MHDDGLDTLVAGVRCREVLDDLSAFLDGELSDQRVSQLQAHLAGCDRCTRFGGSVARVLADLRTGLATPAPLAPDDTARLVARVTAAMRQ